MTISQYQLQYIKLLYILYRSKTTIEEFRERLVEKQRKAHTITANYRLSAIQMLVDNIH